MGKILGHHVMSSTPIVILDSSLRSDKWLYSTDRHHTNTVEGIWFIKTQQVKMPNPEHILGNVDTENTSLEFTETNRDHNPLIILTNDYGSFLSCPFGNVWINSRGNFTCLLYKLQSCQLTGYYYNQYFIILRTSICFPD